MEVLWPSLGDHSFWKKGCAVLVQSKHWCLQRGLATIIWHTCAASGVVAVVWCV